MTLRSVAVVMASLFWTPVAAQTGAVSPLRIDSASPDVATATLTIAGSGFGTRPFVTLDLVPLNIQVALDQRILVKVPIEMIPPGSYLLTVTRGAQASDTASVDLRIGADAAASASASPGAGTAAMPADGAGAGGSSSAAAVPTRPAEVSLLGPSDPVARVGDRTFTVADVDRAWQQRDPAGYLGAARRLYDARRRIVTDLVNDEVLAREAASRGLSVDALLKEEVSKRSVALPDTAVTTLYQTLGDRARGASIDQLRPALREWLARKVEPDLAKMNYIEELTKLSTKADITLLPPRVMVERYEDDPAVGPPDAPVELAIFGDFQSHVYARFALTIPRVRDMFGARVRFVFKHFPANDPVSIAAAEAAACANLQGKFWNFHDTLLGQAGALDTPRFKRIAAEISLDRAKFDACVDREETRDRIGRALEETGRYDLRGTPSLLVNGRLAPDPPAFLPPFEYFRRLIEEELARQAPQQR